MCVCVCVCVWVCVHSIEGNYVVRGMSPDDNKVAIYHIWLNHMWLVVQVTIIIKNNIYISAFRYISLKQDVYVCTSQSKI